MVIDQINLKSVAPIEAEYDPPGARDPHGPEALPLPFQGVQPALPVDTIANTRGDLVGRGVPRRQRPEFQLRYGFPRRRPGTPGPTGGLDRRYAQGSCRAGRAPPTALREGLDPSRGDPVTDNGQEKRVVSPLFLSGVYRSHHCGAHRTEL